MQNSLVDFKKVLYSIVVGLVFSSCFLQTQATDDLVFDPIYDTNDIILKNVFYEENIFPDYKKMKNTKEVYAEYTEGSWKGINYTFEYDKQQRIISYKKRINENNSIDIYKIEYHEDGTIKQINHMDERINFKLKSYDTILFKRPDSRTLHVLESFGEDHVTSHNFYYDNLHQLKEMKLKSGARENYNIKYYYKNKKLIKTISTVFDPNMKNLLTYSYVYIYNNKNEVIGYNYNSIFRYEGIKKEKSSYVVSPEGIKEIGKGKKRIVNYTFDHQGRKILTTDTNVGFPYKMKYTYKDF
ncbi:hypothetical protein [Flavobacterium hungaricum]|uniref:Sugar-binding protein n=1 Tax=Flavobacterium hungaricum TaxID=2082725 RepID=A0ABR9TN49_9FLAO|nr:hypothetical protein [Flavobacterium hungaricum]MBE8726780.1 hypothetical protein [Flavobacterium hungaricum]